MSKVFSSVEPEFVHGTNMALALPQVGGTSEDLQVSFGNTLALEIPEETTMRSKHSISVWKTLGVFGLALNLAAFTAPQKDQLVELRGFLNGRTEARFRDSDRNKIFVLKPGTRAVIAETKYFPESKNYGLCLNVKNATDLDPNQKCIWVYYDTKNPALNLYSGITDPKAREQIVEAWAKDSLKVTLRGEKNPSKAQAAETTRAVPGIPERKSASSGDQSVSTPAKTREKTTPDTKGVDSETPLKLGIQNIDQLNRNADQAMGTGASTCRECSQAKVQTYEKCNARNDYMENALAALLNQSAYSAFFQAPQKELITASCIQKNMSVFTSSSAFFRQCTSSGGLRAVKKACISENYVNITAKSFNLAADCLGDYISGDKSTKDQVALSLFSLMSLESGMNVNARSSTGPAGPGQMSGGAITAVNHELRAIRAHLAKSDNPNCSQTLNKVLEKPMSPTNSCDRISLSKDNPIKGMAYAFAYQAAARRTIEKLAFNGRIYEGVLSDKLPAGERERLMMELSAWAHNTGPAGILNPVRAQLMMYVRNGKKIDDAKDVTQFLKDLRPYMASHAHSSNRGRHRISETMNYYRNIQNRMALIAEEPRTCLAK